MSLTAEFGAIQKATFEINPTVEALLVDPFATAILNTIAREAPFITDLLDSLLSLIPMDLINSLLQDYDLINKLVSDGLSLKDYVEYIYRKIPTKVYLPSLLNDIHLHNIDRYFDLIAESRRRDNLSTMDTDYAKTLLLFLDKIISGFGTVYPQYEKLSLDTDPFRSYTTDTFKPLGLTSLVEAKDNSFINKSLVSSTNPNGQEFQTGINVPIDTSNFKSIEDLTSTKDTRNISSTKDTLINKVTKIPSFTNSTDKVIGKSKFSSITSSQRKIIDDVIECGFVVADIDRTLRNNKLLSVKFNLTKLKLPNSSLVILNDILNYLGSMSLYDSCQLLSKYTIQDINTLNKLLTSIDLNELTEIITTIFSLTDVNTVINLNTTGNISNIDTTFNSHGYLANVKPVVNLIERYSLTTFDNILSVSLSLKTLNLSVIESYVNNFGIDKIKLLVSLIETYSSIPVIKTLSEVKTYGLEFVNTYVEQVTNNTLGDYLVANPTVNYDLLISLTDRFTLNSIIDTLTLRNNFIMINTNRLLTNINLIPLVNAISNYKLSKWKLADDTLIIFNFTEEITIDPNNDVAINLFDDTIDITNGLITYTKGTVDFSISKTEVNLIETSRQCTFNNSALSITSELSYNITNTDNVINVISTSGTINLNQNYLKLKSVDNTLSIVKDDDNSITLSDTTSTLNTKLLSNAGFTIQNNEFNIVRYNKNSNLVLTTVTKELRLEINSTEIILYDLIEDINFNSTDNTTPFTYTVIGGNSSISYNGTIYTVDLSIDYGIVIEFDLTLINIVINTTTTIDIATNDNLSLTYLNKVNYQLNDNISNLTRLSDNTTLTINSLYNWNVTFEIDNFIITKSKDQTIVKSDEFLFTIDESYILDFKWLTGIYANLKLNLNSKSLILLDLYDHIKVKYGKDKLNFSIVNGLSILLNLVNMIITTSEQSSIEFNDNLLVDLNLISNTSIKFDTPDNNLRGFTIVESSYNIPILSDIEATRLLLSELSESNEITTILTSEITRFGISNSIELSKVISKVGIKKFTTIVNTIEKIDINDMQLMITLTMVRIPYRLSVITNSLTFVLNTIKSFVKSITTGKNRLLNVAYTNEEKVDYLNAMLGNLNNYINGINYKLDSIILKNKSFDNGYIEVTEINNQLSNYISNLTKLVNGYKVTFDHTDLVTTISQYIIELGQIQKDYFKFITKFNTGEVTTNNLFNLINTINKTTLSDIIKIIEVNSLYFVIDRLTVNPSLKGILVNDSLFTIASYGNLENCLDVILNYNNRISNQYRKNTINLLLENFRLSNQPVLEGSVIDISIEFVNSLNSIYEKPFESKGFIDHSLLMNTSDDSLSLLSEHPNTKLMATIHKDLKGTFNTKTKFKVIPLKKIY